MNIRYKVAPGQKQFETQLKELLQTFAQGGETIYKARNEIRRMLWHDSPVIVKSFKLPNRLRGLIYGNLRKSKAERSFENSLKLQEYSIKTPTPIGFIEYRSAGTLKQSFYVSHKWLANTTLSEPLFNQTFPDRQEILKAFGRFAWELHRKQVHHQDLSAGNILISVSKENLSESDFSLVDVNRMRFESLSLKERMNNFAMLWASDEDLEIIVSSYAHASGDNPKKAISLALRHSRQHKARATRKEWLKTLLNLH